MNFDNLPYLIFLFRRITPTSARLAHPSSFAHSSIADINTSLSVVSILFDIKPVQADKNYKLIQFKTLLLIYTFFHYNLEYLLRFEPHWHIPLPDFFGELNDNFIELFMSDSFESDNLRSGNTDHLDGVVNYPLPDLTYLRDMAESDESFVNEIITHFLENGPESLSSMRQSALAGDYEKLRFTAHKLLPQLTFVGILAAIPLVTKIESESKNGQDLSDITERAIRIINFGIEDLKKMI